MVMPTPTYSVAKREGEEGGRRERGGGRGRNEEEKEEEGGGGILALQEHIPLEGHLLFLCNVACSLHTQVADDTEQFVENA